MRQFLRYFLRWQLSTPVLLLFIAVYPGNLLMKVALANLLVSLLYYFSRKSMRQQSTSGFMKARRGDDFIPYTLRTSMWNKVKLFKLPRKFPIERRKKT